VDGVATPPAVGFPRLFRRALSARATQFRLLGQAMAGCRRFIRRELRWLRGRAMLFEFTPADLANDRKSIAALLEALGGDIAPHRGAERRATPRQRTAVPISLIPVDEHLRPTDEGYRGITRDVSASGLSFLHHRHVPARYLIAQF